MRERPRRALAALCLLLAPPAAVAALYLRSLDYELAWTDSSSIGQRTMIRPAGEVLDAFGEPLHRVAQRGDAIQQPFYRPLQVVVLSRVAHSVGSEPRHFRSASLAIASLYAALCALLGWVLWRRVGPALFAALFVAVHPVGIEGTVWISGSSGPLCALFSVSALALALGSCGSRRAAAALALGALSVLALLGGLLSKERAVVEPALLLAAFASAPWSPWVVGDSTSPPARRTARRRALALLTAHAALTAAYALWWRPIVLGESPVMPAPVGGSAGVQLLTGIAGWPASLGWLFFPIESTTSSSVRLATSLASPAVWLGLLLAAGSALAWWHLLRSGRRVAALGLAWLWIAFLPTAGLLPLLHPRADRYLFLSAFGAALLLADLGAALLGHVRPGLRRWLAPALAVLALALLAQRTWARVPDWQSTFALFERDLARDHSHREGHFLLAAAHFERGRFTEADAHLRALLSAPPEPGISSYLNQLALHELACANELGLRRYREILALQQRVERSLASVARLPTFRGCVGQAHFALGHDARALEIFLEVQRELGDATPGRLYLLIARSSARLGRRAEAREWLERAQVAARSDAALYEDVRRLRSRLRRRP
ncbi:MAG: tetratricopeptide repeat protein [Myxococcota bacterium]